MQDIHTRTVYEGLKGHRNRENLLEEFLTDLQVKEPVSLSVTDRDRSYRVPEAVVVDTVEVKKNTWGYVEVEIEAEGNFLELMMRKASEKDFKEDTLQIGYRIHPKLLHRGKNTGCIYIRTLREGDCSQDFRGRGRDQRHPGDAGKGMEKASDPLPYLPFGYGKRPV